VAGRELFFDPSWKAVGDSVWILALLDARLKMGLIRRAVASFVYSTDSLSMQSQAEAERRRLHDSAPFVARLLAPLTKCLFRFRRLAAGGYTIRPHRYMIYTPSNIHHRSEFHASLPTHRWPGT
jgi:hypothetical protein